MILSWALYGGIFLFALSLVATFQSMRLHGTTMRAPGLIGVAVSLAFIIVALYAPAKSRRITTARSQLDRIIPEFQFVEVHTIYVDAPPERAQAAMRAVTPEEIRFYRTLVAIRRWGDDRVSILNPPRGEPIIDVATRTGFEKLFDQPNELVIGMYVIPKYAFAAMNFTVTPEGKGSRVTTETRVFANHPRALQRFTKYWRMIHPGSAIIRRSWLAAIKRRAEAPSNDQALPRTQRS